MKPIKLNPKQKSVGLWAVIAAGVGAVMYTSDDPAAMLTDLIKMFMLM